MGNIPKVSIVFSNGNLLQNIPAIDGQAALIGSGTGSAEMPLLTPKAINSLNDLVDLGIGAEVVPEVLPSFTILITAIGADGDIIAPTVNGVVIGTYTKITADSTTALLAAKVRTAIEAGVPGYSAVLVGSTITARPPAGAGASLNGVQPLAGITGTIAATVSTLAGGVTFKDNTGLYRHVKEFYKELAGNQELFIMLVADTVTMEDMLDSTSLDYANKLIDFADGKIGALGVFRIPEEGYDPGEDFMDADVPLAVNAAKGFVQAQNAKLKFLRVLIEGRIADEDSGTIYSPNEASNGFAGVVLGGSLDDGSASVGAALGRKMKYACHIKIGKVANGPLALSSVYIGSKKLKDVTNLEPLLGNGYISFLTYPNKAGFFFGIDFMASNDDYAILVHGAVVDAAARVAAAVYIEDLESEVDTNPDGTITDIDAKHLEDTIIQQVSVSLGDRISGFDALVDRTVNIINTNTAKIKLRVRPKGYLTFIEVDLGLTAGN